MPKLSLFRINITNTKHNTNATEPQADFLTCEASSLQQCCLRCHWRAEADICPSTTNPLSPHLKKTSFTI